LLLARPVGIRFRERFSKSLISTASTGYFIYHAAQRVVNLSS
jgi:hypothetical protein